MEKLIALKSAIMENSTSRCAHILQSGVNFENSDDNFLLTALFVDNAKVVELLLNHGARPDHMAIKSALVQSDEKVLEMLLRHVDLAELRKVENLLLWSIVRNNSDAVKFCEYFIKCGFDVNELSENGFSPLARALDTSREKLEVVLTLLQYGANPLQECNTPLGLLVPLKFSSSYCSTRMTKCMIKYAVLQLAYASDRKIKKFFKIFEGKGKRTISYLKFAQSCLAELNLLKGLNLKGNRYTLLDFILSQGEVLSSLVEDKKIIDIVFNILNKKCLSLYQLVILRKFERKRILCRLLKASPLRWNAKRKKKGISLNTYCMENICKFLSKEDLAALFTVLKTETEK